VNDEHLRVNWKAGRPLRVRGCGYGISEEGLPGWRFPHDSGRFKTAYSLRRHPAIPAGIPARFKFSLSSVHPPGGGRTSWDAERDVSGA